MQAAKKPAHDRKTGRLGYRWEASKLDVSWLSYRLEAGNLGLRILLVAGAGVGAEWQRCRGGWSDWLRRRVKVALPQGMCHHLGKFRVPLPDCNVEPREITSISIENFKKYNKKCF